MRTFVCLSVFLGLLSFLTAHYSFWLAVGILYLGSMLIVAVIAFAARSRNTGVSNSVFREEMHRQVKVEKRQKSEDLNAA